MEKLNLAAIGSILKAHDVEYAAIFGSYARGEARPDSDVDILIRLRQPKSFFELGRLKDQLANLMEKKIDLVTEKAISPYIKKYVLRDLQVIYGQR